MKKEYIVKKNWEFQKIIDNKKQIVTSYYVLYYLPNNVNHLRVGISIPKKFANAPDRNLNRRHIREILHKIDNIWSLNIDIVIILRKNVIEAKFAKKEKELKKVFERLTNEL